MYFVLARSGQAMPSSASAAFRSKYGKYLPHQRFKVDQMPLPFINGMDETY